MEQVGRKYKCCICGRNGFDEHGNDAYPYFISQRGECCDWCYKRYVIPAKLILSKSKKEE